jgi:ParB family transcriptional regulator, chromosome partitioning protein
MAKKKSFQISNALTEGLEETVNAAHNYTGELRVEAINLKKIELDPENPRDLVLTFDDLYHGIDKADKDYNRKVAEKTSLLSMANSIEEQGIINPVVVYKYSDKYRLIAGERRTLASIIAGKTAIQAKILDAKPDELKISLLQWMENVERKDLTLWERLRNLEKIIASYTVSKSMHAGEITATDVGRLLGCSLPHAMNYFAILKADKHIKELIQVNKLKNLEKAAVIATIRSDSLQRNAIEECLAGATLKKLKAISIQDKPKKPLIQRTAETRGRIALAINLGTTKQLPVAKLIIDAILNHEKASHIRPHFTDLNWADYKSINHAFKQLLKTLEKIEA